MIEALAIIFNAVGDRIRGGLLNKWKLPAGVTGGIIFTALLMWVANIPYDTALLYMRSNYWLVPSFEVWLMPLVFIGYLIGESWSWGVPLGAYLREEPMKNDPKFPHWWQKGVLRESAELALVVRGAMWGTMIAIPLYFYDVYLALSVIIAYTCGMLAAPMISRHYWPEKDAHTQWSYAEYIRGGYVMAVIYLYVLL